MIKGNLIEISCLRPGGGTNCKNWGILKRDNLPKIRRLRIFGIDFGT